MRAETWASVSEVFGLTQFGHGDGRRGQRSGGSEVAAAAIGMGNPQAIAVFVGGRVIVLMAMLVMPKMRGGCPGRLVPAIRGGGTPDELELHHEQQKDEEPTSHVANSM